VYLRAHTPAFWPLACGVRPGVWAGGARTNQCAHPVSSRPPPAGHPATSRSERALYHSAPQKPKYDKIFLRPRYVHKTRTGCGTCARSDGVKFTPSLLALFPGGEKSRKGGRKKEASDGCGSGAVRAAGAGGGRAFLPDTPLESFFNPLRPPALPARASLFFPSFFFFPVKCVMFPPV
jgi:hypothetical protein